VHALIAKSCAKHAPYKAMGTREFLGMHKTDKAPFPLKVSTGSAVMQRALSCFACYEILDESAEGASFSFTNHALPSSSSSSQQTTLF